MIVKINCDSKFSILNYYLYNDFHDIEKVEPKWSIPEIKRSLDNSGYSGYISTKSVNEMPEDPLINRDVYEFDKIHVYLSMYIIYPKSDIIDNDTYNFYLNKFISYKRNIIINNLIC